MKILLLNWQDRLNPAAGGAETHLHEIFGRLAARGHDVTMLVSGWRGAPATTSIDSMRVLRTGGRHSFSVAAPLYYRRHLTSERFDVVVEALNKVPLFSPRWTADPVVLLVHHLFGVTAFQEAPIPIAAATWLLERPIAKVYRGRPVQAISVSTADDLAHRGIDHSAIAVIHPGVDLDFFTPPNPEGRRFETPTFLYLGRLKRYKRVDLIIRASSILRREGVRHRILIAGTGDDRERLERLARTEAADVEFLGFVSEERKRELFRRAWANVFTSPREGWGITNLEAAACGTPTIASDSPGLRESVVHGETGLLVRHGAVGALAGAMRDLARDPQRVDTLGGAATRFAREFTWDRAANHTERHLQESIR